MSNKTNILITGVTGLYRLSMSSNYRLKSPLLGYIGGSVLARFLQRPDFSSFNITALVRSPEKADKLRALKVNAVVGSHSDVPLMESLAADSDYVIATVCV